MPNKATKIGIFDTPDKGSGKINWKIPAEVVKILVTTRKTHLLFPYRALSRDKAFSGFVTSNKLDQFAKAYGVTKRTALANLDALEKLHMVTKHVTGEKTTWMLVGADIFTARCGRSRVNFMHFPENVSKKDITALAHQVFAAEEYKRKTSPKHKKEKSPKVKDFEKIVQATTQDSGDVLKPRTQISSSFTSGHILFSTGKRISRQTISKHRAKAKRLGFVGYDRAFHLKHMLAADGSLIPMAGGREIAEAFLNRPYNSGGHDILSYRKGKGTYAWFQEHPATFFSIPKFSSRGMSSKLKSFAINKYNIITRNK